MVLKICYLRCVQGKYNNIQLPDCVPVRVGRLKTLGLKDIQLSRKHLLCTADIPNERVAVKMCGTNLSGCNGYALLKGKTYTFKHKDRLELLLGKLQFDIIFEEPGSDNDCSKTETNQTPTKKPRLASFSHESKESSGQIFSGNGNWEDVDKKALLIYTAQDCYPKTKIAAFDLDGTIVKTKSGARFPKNNKDWTFIFDNVVQKINKLFENDYKIVIFTNQAGLSNDTSKIRDFKTKIEDIALKLKVPIQVFVATGKSIYRKPLPGMWEVLIQQKNGGITVDKEKSFYVGDAAGRKKNWAPKKNKDHAISDRLFALNLGLKFYTPEEYFFKATPAPYTMPEFDPTKEVCKKYPEISYNGQEVILMVGMQGSGKSYFCKKILIPKGYIYINRDILGSWQKCINLLEESIKQNESAVVDNTNPDKATRKKYLEIAKKHGFKCRCFVMSTSYKQAKHNNRFRELTDKSHTPVSDIIINMFKSKFEAPTLEEGFDEIVEIPCAISFDNSDDETLYKMYLLES